MQAKSPEVYEEILLKYRQWAGLRNERQTRLKTWIDWWDNRKRFWSDVSIIFLHDAFNALKFIEFSIIAKLSPIPAQLDGVSLNFILHSRPPPGQVKICSYRLEISGRPHRKTTSQEG